MSGLSAAQRGLGWRREGAPAEGEPRRILLARPRIAALMTAGLSVAASLAPSLLPRSWITQGLVSGVSLAVGYGLGSGAGAVLRPVARRLPLRLGWWGRLLAAAVVAVALGWGLVVHQVWQVDVRRLMGMDGPGLLYPVLVFALALVVGALLVLTARTVLLWQRILLRLLRRVLPRRSAAVVRAALTALLVVLVLDVAVAERAFGAIEAGFDAEDAGTEVGVVPPVSQARSGGPGSLVAWEVLGRQGRAFVAGGPSLAELTASSNGPTTEPVRVYVGLRSGPSARQRAALAVAELERTGAFQREVLVILNPTGTGWIDPHAVDPLELMHRGNTAAVAVQYSYRPSWVQMIGNQDLAKETARALFEAVHERWVRLPETSRPRLLVFGESLGAFGSEAVFAGLDDVRQRTDGVLWVGSPRAAGLWQQLTTEREPGSPVWQPVHNGGTQVRFGADCAALTAPLGPWAEPRIVYLQNASDPITWWTTDLLFDRPEWLTGPRGPDVSKWMPYLPVVTFLQMSVDLVTSQNVPFGHGHSYGPAQAEAWALIAPPDRETQTAALPDELDCTHGGAPASGR